MKKYNISQDFLIEEYTRKQKSQGEIGKSLGISQWVISQRLREFNIKTREKTWKLTENKYYKKYHVNANYFDELNPEKAWVIGWLLSDGFINRESKVFGIRLSQKDHEVLLKIKTLIGYSGPIYEYSTVLKKTNKIYYGHLLQIANITLVKRLKEIGIQSNKSQKEKFPEEIKNSNNENIIKSFIKGFFEGDGSILYTKIGKKDSLLFQIVGTQEVLLDIQHFLIKYLGLNKTKLTHNIKNRNHWALRYRGNYQSIRIFDWLYSDNELHLNRKYNKYLQVKEDLAK